MSENPPAKEDALPSPQATSEPAKEDPQNLQIYARVRKIMPWEPDMKSIKFTKTHIETLSGQKKSYQFSQVFDPSSDNESVFNKVCKPMCEKVLEGFNAVVIAYGQTGSGKTHSLLGKPKRKVIGILPMVLEYFINCKNVEVELSALEAFGHHVNRIEIYDLFHEKNNTKNWADKDGNTTIDPSNVTVKKPKDAIEGRALITQAHASSHFAPTGKNPESSRGHISFIIKCKQTVSEHQLMTSYFVISDLAGSEGETAFTPEFKRKVDPSTLVARRLEAGVINMGLSQLQVIFNELKFRGRLSKMVGVGLRRVLHPYINTKCVLSVLFCISPSLLNIRPTSATLKFAVQAGMVTVKPIKEQIKTDWRMLVKGLNAMIAELNKDLDDRDRTIEEQEKEIETLTDDIAKIKAAKASGMPSGAPEVHHQPSKRAHVRQRSQLPSNMADMLLGAQEEIEEMENMGTLVVADLNEDEVDKEIFESLQEKNQLNRGDTYSVAAVFGEKAEELIRRQSTINLYNDESRSSLPLPQGSRKRIPVLENLSSPPPEVGVEIIQQRSNLPSTKKLLLHDVASKDFNAVVDGLDVIDDSKLDDDIVVNFEDPHLEASIMNNLNKDQLIERCEVLESMFEAEKALNESYHYSQQVIIDHLSETNEGLLAYFRVKFQVLNNDKKKKKKKKDN